MLRQNRRTYVRSYLTEGKQIKINDEVKMNKPIQKSARKEQENF